MKCPKTLQPVHRVRFLSSPRVCVPASGFPTRICSWKPSGMPIPRSRSLLFWVAMMLLGAAIWFVSSLFSGRR